MVAAADHGYFVRAISGKLSPDRELRSAAGDELVV
jgi:hypothetical protein